MRILTDPYTHTHTHPPKIVFNTNDRFALINSKRFRCRGWHSGSMLLNTGSEFRYQKVRFLPPARCRWLHDERYRKNKNNLDKFISAAHSLRCFLFSLFQSLPLFVIIILSPRPLRKRSQKYCKNYNKNKWTARSKSCSMQGAQTKKNKKKIPIFFFSFFSVLT